MKSASPQMLAFLLSTGVESIYKADLFQIALIDGTNIYATDGQVDIQYQGHTYSGSANGAWKRGRLSTRLGLQGTTMDLTVMADDTIMVPGRVCTMIQGIRMGLFDGATVTVLTAYMPTYGDTSLGVETKFIGQWGDARKIGRTVAEVECQSFLYLLNQQMPKALLQTNCRWPLYGAGCTLSASSFASNNSAAAGSTQGSITAATTITQPDGYYTQGTIKFLSGDNAGLSTMITAHTGQALTIMPRLMFPVATGDEFTIYAGCDHRMSTCQSRFGNLQNFGGAPFIPNPENAISI